MTETRICSAVSRRTVVIGVASVAFAYANPLARPAVASLHAALPLNRFMAASEALTGKSGLDPVFAAQLLEALTADASNLEPLRALLEAQSHDGTATSAKQADARLAGLEHSIRVAWYTGVYKSANAQNAYTFENALCWRAAPYLQPPGICGGKFGDWANPPAP